MILVSYRDKNVDDILRADQGPLTSNIETSGAGRKGKDSVQFDGGSA